MIKSLAVVSLFSALSFGTAGLAFAQTHEPEHKAVQEQLNQPPYTVYEGRSIQKGPGASYVPNESGYQTGIEENPKL
ncbi:MAG TPA: hypothetical protein VEQ35_01090 [Beijerinckia sp.]|jgi:hypothetical protein|nr:hypothetical protein [Beijerinckia sp.]